MRRPFTIGIAGAHSGSGKTTLAVALLRYLTKPLSDSGITRPMPLSALKRWGAIKYTRSVLYSSIVDDRSILLEKDKDTRRLLDAGAEEVLWVQSPRADLEGVLPIALERLYHLDGIVIEGNSAIEFISPDIVLFIFGVSSDRIKPSAHLTLGKADFVLIPEGTEGLSGVGEEPAGEASSPVTHRRPMIVRIGPFPRGLDEEKMRELVEGLSKVAIRKSIEESLREKAIGGKITCGDARRIAEELGVHYGEVGKAANGLKIKIRNCELGCF